MELADRYYVPMFKYYGLQQVKALDGNHIYLWDGNYYALAVTERLGLEESGGMVRVGPVHYNAVQEIERFGEVLGRLVVNPS